MTLIDETYVNSIYYIRYYYILFHVVSINFIYRINERVMNHTTDISWKGSRKKIDLINV